MASELNKSDPALLGILALLAAERDPKAQPPTEVLLARVGLAYEDIAPVVGKTPEAVRKAASRAGAAKPKAKKAKAKKEKK